MSKIGPKWAVFSENMANLGVLKKIWGRLKKMQEDAKTGRAINHISTRKIKRLRVRMIDHDLFYIGSRVIYYILFSLDMNFISSRRFTHGLSKDLDLFYGVIIIFIQNNII